MRKTGRPEKIAMCVALAYAAGLTTYGISSGNHEWIWSAAACLIVHFTSFFYYAFYGVRSRDRIEVRFVDGEEKR